MVHRVFARVHRGKIWVKWHLHSYLDPGFSFSTIHWNRKGAAQIPLTSFNRIQCALSVCQMTSCQRHICVCPVMPYRPNQESWNVDFRTIWSKSSHGRWIKAFIVVSLPVLTPSGKSERVEHKQGGHMVKRETREVDGWRKRQSGAKFGGRNMKTDSYWMRKKGGWNRSKADILDWI